MHDCFFFEGGLKNLIMLVMINKQARKILEIIYYFPLRTSAKRCRNDSMPTSMRTRVQNLSTQENPVRVVAHLLSQYSEGRDKDSPEQAN